jgi:hypothetical protein
VGRTLLSDAFDFAFDLDFDTHMPNRTLDRKYDYRRMLPHHQKAGRALFVTFCKGNRTAFAPETRDAILQHCLHDRGKRYELHAAVVMPGAPSFAHFAKGGIPRTLTSWVLNFLYCP